MHVQESQYYGFIVFPKWNVIMLKIKKYSFSVMLAVKPGNMIMLKMPWFCCRIKSCF